ncbi:hypothetical protein Pla110_19700 [Polystyrenella longa]|uniref:3-keto-alpha-glucoside-1,2-lyase/3-keto-2-hydroxy-glucal hydratase domain-containing protein n=1 Tax=Polystyrenella longa TaxID=2528007 RepID=A0A518CLZ0_9PLAN|nr:DUF1080 domain-containing protein [Polystyrenella longa]QDU80246.1 hypothetical protein Pla110_19700 [Polystyrenella longa]
MSADLSRFRCLTFFSFAVTALLLSFSGTLFAEDKETATETQAETDSKNEDQEWKLLFDGKSLKDWKTTKFGGEGDVTVEEGNMVIGFGVDLSGVNYTGKTPTQNYEVELEAKRIDGNDFFCGLTFPVEKSSCSLIVGGWGGGLCGLSSLNGNDAAENETATWQSFEDDKWYKIRLRVEPEQIQAWIDDERIVNANIKGRTLTVRGEVLLSRPFGIATWQTSAALRNIRIRELKKSIEAKAESTEVKE